VPGDSGTPFVCRLYYVYCSTTDTIVQSYTCVLLICLQRLESMIMIIRSQGRISIDCNEDVHVKGSCRAS
jgi:hypothetical protein